MATENMKLKTIRDKSPCKGCTERFPACGDHCPKDERGERGYKAWKAELERIKEKKRAYENLPFSPIK